MSCPEEQLLPLKVDGLDYVAGPVAIDAEGQSNAVAVEISDRNLRGGCCLESSRLAARNVMQKFLFFNFSCQGL